MAGRGAPEQEKKRSGSENRARKVLVAARFTPEEHAALVEKAEAMGLSIGGYLRACGLKKVTPGTQRRVPVDRVILERAITQLRRVGNNINQIARAANMNEPTDSAQLNQALDEFTAVLNFLREARGG